MVAEGRPFCFELSLLTRTIWWHKMLPWNRTVFPLAFDADRMIKPFPVWASLRCGSAQWPPLRYGRASIP